LDQKICSRLIAFKEVKNCTCSVSGLSIRFEVGGYILKVDGYGFQRAPSPSHRRDLGGAEAPSRVQGQSPRNPKKQNEFDILALPKIAFPAPVLGHLLFNAYFLCHKRI